jgi:hypothetical protein
LKKIILITLFFTAAMSLSSQYFFDDYTDAQKIDAAHSYLMVSEQFAKIGDTKQASKFKEMALFIYPELLNMDRETIETVVEEEKPAPHVTGPDRSGMIRYYFSKLLRSVTTGDLETADSLIAERLYLPQYDGGLTKAQLAPMVREIREKYNLAVLSPSDLYKIETISVEKLEESTYILTVEGADDESLYRAGITFFGRTQTFRFRHFESGWKLDRITALF